MCHIQEPEAFSAPSTTAQKDVLNYKAAETEARRHKRSVLGEGKAIVVCHCHCLPLCLPSPGSATRLGKSGWKAAQEKGSGGVGQELAEHEPASVPRWPRRPIAS